MSTTPLEQHDDDKRMELSEHLAELRTRIMRSILYVVVASGLSYYGVRPIYDFFYQPMDRALKGSHIEFKIVFPHFTEAFFVVLQICVVAGLLIVSPLVILEMWGFIRPALTRKERRPLRWIVPMSIVLFISGAWLAYWVAQYAMNWFIGYVKLFPEAVLYQDPRTYVLFVLKLMAIFGVVFQLPLALMFLAWAGLLKSQTMKQYWRHAIVGIAFGGLMVTPSNDVFTMLMMVIPVFTLYLGSIGLVQIMERSRMKRASDA